MTEQSPQRIAWITGGSTGIGLAIARSLCEAGCLVVLSARNEEPLAAACTELVREGGKADHIVADVTDRAGINHACRTIIERYGRIDILVNNAGFNVQKRKWDELIAEEFDAVIAANLTGAFNAIHAVLPVMRAQHDGLIVNVSSVAGKNISPEGGVAYSVAKHGVHVMSQLLNQSEIRNGIRTCVVAPGGVNTRAHDWRLEEVRAMMLQPEDVARAVRFAVDTPRNTAIFEIEICPAPF